MINQVTVSAGFIGSALVRHLIDDTKHSVINLDKLTSAGEIGETYNIGGHNEKQNIEVVKTICTILDELMPLDGRRKTEDGRRKTEDVRRQMQAARHQKESRTT